MKKTFRAIGIIAIVMIVIGYLFSIDCTRYLDDEDDVEYVNPKINK